MGSGAESEVALRPLQPADGPALKLLHQQLFPLDYDASFYTSSTHGLDGVAGWAATARLPSTVLHVDAPPASQHHSLLQQQYNGSDGSEAAQLLAGFITTRAFPALYADPHDRRLLELEGPQADQERLLYVLTLGVQQSYQRLGIARRLLHTVLRHAAGTACRAVYLHVASFNAPALAFYRREGFRELATLRDFYSIRTGREPEPGRTVYDARLFGCRIAPPPSPWAAANLALAPLTSLVGSLNGCLGWGGALQRRDECAGTAAAERDPAAPPQHRQQQQQQQWQPPQHEQQQQEQQQQQLGGVPRYSRHPPGGPFLQQQPAASVAAGKPPDWIKGLFRR